MSAVYEPGAILKVTFSGRVDGQVKARPVLFWMRHKSNPEILVSGIFGTPTGRDWELPLRPGVHNGLTKECVLRVDNTLFVNADIVIKPLGSLNVFEFASAKDLMIRYSEHFKFSSPEDFGDDLFSIFN